MYGNQWRSTTIQITVNAIKKLNCFIPKNTATNWYHHYRPIKTATATIQRKLQQLVVLQQYQRLRLYRCLYQPQLYHYYFTIRCHSNFKDQNSGTKKGTKQDSWETYQQYIANKSDRHLNQLENKSNSRNTNTTTTTSNKNIPSNDNTIYYYYKTDNINDNMPSKSNLPDDDDGIDNTKEKNDSSNKHKTGPNKKFKEKKNANAQKKAFARQYTDPDTGLVIIEEGSCSMCIEATEMNDVFYNPVQVQNRDLSIVMLQLYHERRQQSLKEETDAYMKRRKELILLKRERALQLQEEEKDEKEKETTAMEEMTTGTTTDIPTTENGTTGFTSNTAEPSLDVDDIDLVIEVPKVQLKVLDALAASGLRSLRYWKECSEFISHITINDIDPIAGERARRNIEQNKLTDSIIPDTQPFGRPNGIRIITQDATTVMYNSRVKRGKRLEFPSLAHLHVRPKDQPPPIVSSLTPEEESQRQWDVIDIDPYGSAAIFIDAAVQSITNGGLLNITCTDLRTMCGTHTPESALARYGALPLKSVGYCHDYAIRMLLYLIASTAGRYGRSMKPILSVGMDFYIRVFVEIYDDKRAVQDLPLKVGMVYQSTQCPSFYTLPLATESSRHKYNTSRIPNEACTETGAPLKVGGPIWLGPLHDQDVLQKALQRLQGPQSINKMGNTPTNVRQQQEKQPDDEPITLQQESSSLSTKSLEYIATRERLHGLLTSCSDELPDAPLYYLLNQIASCANISVPPIFEIKSALVNAGYRASGHHREALAIKTNAPSSVFWDVIRGWVKRRPTDKPPTPGSAAEKIFGVEPSFEADFSRPWSISQTKEKFANTKRFPGNPERNWGPKPKAFHGQKRKSTDDE